MPLLVNMRHLEAHDVRLEGQMASEELDIDTRDEMIRLAGPLDYTLDAQKIEDGLLVQGELGVTLDCQCVRCLKPFQYRLSLDAWACHVPLAGEEQAPMVSDCVDLTPFRARRYSARFAATSVV